MGSVELLSGGQFYHIFNRGNDGGNIFNESADYEWFLNLYDKYIFPVAETYAWVLMPNHFHFLVKIKDGICYKYSKEDSEKLNTNFEEIKWQTINIKDLIISPQKTDARLPDLEKIVKNCDQMTRTKDQKKLSIPKPHLHFSHFFNAYSKYFNNRFQRHGTLFERPFKRKPINNEYYLKQVILYIHNNPVHHGFCEHAMGYPWSSYLTCISIKPTKLQRDNTIGWFDNDANFRLMHGEKLDKKSIEKWLEID